MTQPHRPTPSGAILVGRPNVGKSTLFNRLIGRTAALVSPEAGTTRDLNRGLVDWVGSSFWLTDTGGWVPDARNAIDKATVHQLERALTEAAVTLLVIDGQVGITPEDRQLAQTLRRRHIPTILVINKVDSSAKRNETKSLSLGFRDTIQVSAKNGSGTGDLLDAVMPYVVNNIPPAPEVRLVLLGQTNVGKSSLFNRFLGYERSIVQAEPHTTRDRQHDFVQAGNITFELVDTAGMRRRLKNAPKLEQQSARQGLDVLPDVDVACLVLDASAPRAWQDQRVGDLIVESGRACVIALNKADLVPVSERAALEKQAERWFPMLHWAPRLWVSAVTGQGVPEFLSAALQAALFWRKTLTPDEIKAMSQLLKRSPTTRHLPFVGFEQTKTEPPSFIAAIKTKENIPVALGGWLEVILRKKFGFQGSPVNVRLQSIRRK